MAKPATPPAPPPPPAPARRWPAWLPLAILVAAVLAAYLPVRHAGFIWDDDSHVTDNPSIVGGLGLGRIWTSPAANYFPLTTSTFWVIHALWGVNPLPYHVVDVLLHLASAALLWLVLRRLRVPGAWLGAMLWALHPVQVESAAWISETKNTQSAVFYLLAIWLFLRWLEAEPGGGRGRRVLFFAGAWLCAALAILSKASTVMLPVVLGLCWWWVRGRWRWRDALWLLPFLAISVTASLWTIWEQQYHAGAIGQAWDQTHLQRLIIAGNVVWFYLGKLVWPHPLIFIYPRWAPDASSLPAYLPAVAAAGVFLALWWWRARLRGVFFAGAVFGVSLFPVLGFFNVYFFRYSFVADHFQYLASMGALALAGAGLAALADAWRAAPRWLAAAPPAVLLVALEVLTWRQGHHYYGDEGLWRATLADNPGCWMAHNNLGAMEVKAAHYEAAIDHLTTSLGLHPGVQQAEYNLGLALFRTNRPGEALPHYEAALRLLPNDPDTLARIGDALAKLNRVPEAIRAYEAVLRANPQDANSQNNLGNMLRLQGRGAEALARFQEAVRLKPAFADAQNNLGSALFEAGRVGEAVTHLQEAVRLDPASIDAHTNLAIALLRSGRPDAAVVQLREVTRLSPRDPRPHFMLGRVLLQLGRARDAADEFQETLRHNPGDAPAQEGLEIARQQVGP
ncbi:MAG TPA: tetratricopeptide repeat protein [Opitutaceae bacterium]|nr:tetratricopeptide repeat protein [Opitutaceae bacterium]